MVQNSTNKAGVIIAAIALAVALLNLTPTVSMIFQVFGGGEGIKEPTAGKLVMS